MIVAGIDPGKTGALAIIYPDGNVHFFDVPLIDIKGKSVPAWSEWNKTWCSALDFAGVDLVTIEEVTAGQNGIKQGVQSMFNFGRALGFAHGIAMGITPRPVVRTVPPSVWKPKYGLTHAGKGASREKCRTLYPKSEPFLTRVKDDGRAEAALIADYGKRNFA